MRQVRRKKYLSILLLAVILCSLSASLLLARPAAAQAKYETGWEIIPPECLGKQGQGDEPCTLNSFIQMFVNLAKIGLKVLPYLAMIMMIWAGFNLIMAGGNTQKIEEGKKMVSSVVVGVIIILFLAWCYSYFVVSIMTGSTKVFPGYIWEKDWWGGGTANQAQGGTGCCVNTTAMWCQEQTYKDDCEAAGGEFQGYGSSCATGSQAVCANYAAGCCVPDVPTDTNCQYPDSITACKDLPGYHNVIDHTCFDIDQCLAGIAGMGCCVPDIVADDPGSWSDCRSPLENTLCSTFAGTTFRQHVPCTDFPICKAGCCTPYCSTAVDMASEYWCGNQDSGATTWHSGTCNDQETDLANCCSIPLADSNNYKCLFADGGNQINRQHCLDLGGEYDTANCTETGHTCQIYLPINDSFCSTH